MKLQPNQMLSNAFYRSFGTPSSYQSSITDLFVSSRWWDLSKWISFPSF